jgi:hypothetical protein
VNDLKDLEERSWHEILVEADRAVLTPSRHAGKIKAHDTVEIVRDEDGILRCVVDGKHVLHIETGSDNMIKVRIRSVGDLDRIGLIPGFLREDDIRPAREQFDERYKHGGGWHPLRGFELVDGRTLKYPGDPPMEPIAIIVFRDETICVYKHGIVTIIQPSGAFEVARMD